MTARRCGDCSLLERGGESRVVSQPQTLVVKPHLALFLIALFLMAGSGFSQAQPAQIVGRWKVDVSFSGGESRSLRFEAQESGKGSFTPVVPRPNQAGSAEPATAQWSQSENGAVAFSGPVQFPLGNVGFQRGTLVLKGKVGSDGSIAGEAKFFPVDQDPSKAQPSKSGSFRAVRLAG